MFSNILIQSTSRGIGTITLTNKVPKTATVEDLELIIQDEHNGMLTNLRFVYLGKTMTDKKKKLSYYKVRNNSSIFCPMKLKGGSQMFNNKITEYQQKQLTDRTSNSEISPSLIKFNSTRLQKFNITLTDTNCKNYTNESCNSSGKVRFRMPNCVHDHIQCYNCVKQYIYKGLFINADTILECRKKECGELDFDALSAVLNWDDKDEQLILQALSTNNMKYADVKACPNPKCGQYIFKDNIKGNRVNCPSCDGKDFCWKCLKEWKATGFDDCGDDECKHNFAAFLDKILDPTECGTKDCPTSGVKNIPRMRLCPGCNELWEWAEQCRHMTCKHDDCGHNYCQSCLKPFKIANETKPCPCRYCRDGGKFKNVKPCSLYTDTCRVAPTQSTVNVN